jgi:hypothetical protein
VAGQHDALPGGDPGQQRREVGLGLLHVDEGRRGGWWTGAGEAVGRDRGLVWLFGQTYQPDQARSNRVERILGNASAAGAIPAAIALGAKRQIKGLGRILKPAKEPQGLLGPG